MSPAFDQIAMTLVRMCVFGPVMFVGLMMAMNPSSFVSLLNDLAESTHRFRGYLRGRWPEPFLNAAFFLHTDRVEAGLRVAGLAIVGFGILGLAEMLG